MPLNTKTFKPIDWTVLATGVISLVALFLPWWGVSFAGYTATVSGWHTSYGWLGGFLVVVAAGWHVLTRGGATVPSLPVSNLVATAGVSLVGLLIILLRWITLPRGGYLGRTFHYGGRAGIWIAAVVAVVQVVALVVLLRQSGERLPWRSR